MSDSQITVPYGYCHCGCGQKTNIAPKTRSYRGQQKGHPMRFLPGHTGSPPADIVRFQIDDETGCWNWTKSISSNGYGFVRIKGRPNKLAHRYVYEQDNGPVAEHLDLDHLCRNRACVNPEHLEPVSRSENLRRGARGKMTRASILAIRLMDASTSLNRVEIGEAFGVSGQTVRRYLGDGKRGRSAEWMRRKEPHGEEHLLKPSTQAWRYPAID